MPDVSITEGEGIYQQTHKDDQGKDQVWYYSQYLGVVTLRDDQLSVQPLIEVNKAFPFSAHIKLCVFC